MWLAALPPPEMATPQHWAGCGVLSPWGSWDPNPPPPVPQLPPEGDRGCAEGGGCSLQIGAGFGWNKLQVPL